MTRSLLGGGMGLVTSSVAVFRQRCPAHPCSGQEVESPHRMPPCLRRGRDLIRPGHPSPAVTEPGFCSSIAPVTPVSFARFSSSGLLIDSLRGSEVTQSHGSGLLSSSVSALSRPVRAALRVPADGFKLSLWHSYSPGNIELVRSGCASGADGGGRSTMHMPRSVGADLRGHTASLIGEPKTPGPTHSSQPLLFTFDLPARHGNGGLSNSAPQDYLFLHQCMSRKAENTRSASFSQAARGGMLAGSDPAVQRLPCGPAHYANGSGTQSSGFNSLPKPGRRRLPSARDGSPRDPCYDLPRGYSPEGRGRETEPKAPLLSNDNYDLLPPPEPPPRPPKPAHGAELQPNQRWGSPQSLGEQNGEAAAPSVAPRRNTLPAVENIRLHRGSSFENSDHHRQGYLSNSGLSTESVSNGLGSNLRAKPTLNRSDSGDSEDNYVPMNPGSASSPFTTAQADSPQNIYIPMSPGPHHFDFPGFSATLPTRKGSTASLCHRPGRLSDITPPPINRNLKPDRKSKPTPLDLVTNGIIDELPFKSPITMSWIRPTPPLNPISSLHCRPISTQSITSTDSGDSEENYVAMVSQNPASTSPAVSGTSSPAPRKSGNVDYLDLDFQPRSVSPHRKPSTSSVTSDEKVDYVQVDKKKTQALQSTMQEWTDVRQSSEPVKGVKS
ncbi:hypothetical protein COCON_G00188090 [Conger conger]|uniref:GRB2-associated-binding protein 2 n=1 Tax=Conger conger TaxID=82655 RepID=A0A9Q1D335_CONCO|nr:hypothetical protein COCON_G00188090 [Conger conger]